MCLDRWCNGAFPWKAVGLLVDREGDGPNPRPATVRRQNRIRRAICPIFKIVRIAPTPDSKGHDQRRCNTIPTFPLLLSPAVAVLALGRARRRQRPGDQSSVAIEIGSESAAAFSARCNCWGNVFPRFSARRRIPRQAFALKKNRCGTSPVSKMSDNEHARPSLGQVEVLSVKNPVGEPIPELPQPSEEGSKRPSAIDRQDTGHVLPDHPLGAKSVSQA